MLCDRKYQRYVLQADPKGKLQGTDLCGRNELGNHLEDALRENDLVLAYGSAEIIDEKFIRRYHFEYHMQAIWLAPQMRYLKDSMKKKLNCFDIPIHIIDMKTFGKMDGKQALQYILNAMI